MSFENAESKKESKQTIEADVFFMLSGGTNLQNSLYAKLGYSVTQCKVP